VGFFGTYIVTRADVLQPPDRPRRARPRHRRPL